ncbi:MAG: Glutathione transport system permease protein GsiC [Anaerolineales bacterium]|nr:Glutathione transport system permease protein GsiC [Anaerolineales bacterium]
MIRHLLRRLLWLPVLLLIVTMITYALGFYGPGDPVKIVMGQRYDPETADRVRHELGLDRPFFIQYGDYVWGLLHGDLGKSIKYRRPVIDLIKSRLWVSFQLNAAALVLGVFAGIPLGVLAAIRHHTWVDYVIVTGTVAGISFPTFVVAPILLWFLAARFRILPPGGWDGLLSTKAVMPIIVLTMGIVAVFVRQTRANMLEVVGQDYVRTARSKGLAERAVVIVHALRNALIPLLTIFGLMVGGLVGGTFIVETIFGIPGIGRLGVQSFFARDYPVIMALTTLIAVAYALANLFVDLGYSIIDPRIRYG